MTNTLIKSPKKPHHFKDITGHKFGMLTAVSYVEKRSKQGSVVWNTICDCGNTRLVVGTRLVNGETFSNCGCVKKLKQLQKQKYKEHRKKQLKQRQDKKQLLTKKTKRTDSYLKKQEKALRVQHRKENAWLKKTYSKIYYSWHYMRVGCNNFNSEGYIRTGFRGIEVCKRWDTIEYRKLIHGFKNFLIDMFPTYKPGLKLNRRDLTKNFDKYNCYWATLSEIHRRADRANSHHISYIGKTRHVSDWAEELNIPVQRIITGLKNRWMMSRIIKNSQELDSNREKFKTDRHCFWCGEVLDRYVGPVKYQKKKYCSLEHYRMYSKTFGRKKGLRRGLNFRKPADAENKLFKMASIKQVSSGNGYNKHHPNIKDN